MLYQIKRNDTRPPITATLSDELGAVPLGSATVTFKMDAAPDSGITGFTPVNGTCTITDADKGIVAYQWTSGDTAVAGVFRAEFEVAFPGGAVETFPSDGYIDIIIREDIA